MKHPEIEGYTYVGTTVHRSVTTTDLIPTREGLIELLKKSLSKENFDSLTEKDIDKAFADMEKAKQLKKAVREYAAPMLEKLEKENTKNKKKKIEELYLLSRLVQSLKKFNEINIINDAEPPDFIVQYKEESIGVEITGLYNDEVVAEINTAKELLRKCEIKLRTETNLKGNIQLQIIPSKLKFSKPQQEIIINEICNYVIAVEQKAELSSLDYISYVFKQESENLDLILYENYWLTNLLTPEKVHEVAFAKEKDIVKYKDQLNLDKCWLLINIGGASLKSSFDYSLLSNLVVDTKFDNLFLFDVFGGKIIYSKNPLLD